MQLISVLIVAPQEILMNLHFANDLITLGFCAGVVSINGSGG